MKTNFDRCLSHVLASEGGWADDPKDPGGATMKGITIGTYRAWKGRAVTKAELRAIPDSEVRAIYRQNYWNPVRGDDLPLGLDLVAFDGAVNSGVSRGAKWLQTAVGVTVDGKIGPQTLAAAKAAHPEAVIDRACSARLAWLRTTKHKDTGKLLWPTYGKGWSIRVESVRETAIAMSKVTAPNATKPAAPSAGIIAALLALFKSMSGGK
ncbi:glycosyl hydrolase 108 family protein [Paracoccus sp. SSJ]|uniref:glycoside hydrolase family 108 protein n=1 Tax=Paracoccus sp. SSJ TaxID=3050636 RepID=UPI00254C3770|nr:glycosyl hydrolase 108 family protein [Paracoccus sp. SSJ]MDK8874421.1 glycosyl hydrolase 108 family protein [Paracoccus sp. SSJ]